ncbi:MAG: glycosyltransferase family 39 protein [Bacteroidia bacterium]
MIRKIYFSDKPLRTILVFSLIIKLTLFFFLQPWKENVVKDRMIVSDAIMYETLAEDLVTRHSFTGSTDKPGMDPNSMYYITHQFDSLKTPGYPFFLAVIYFIFGIKPYVAVLFQIILSSISLVILFRITNFIFQEKKISYIVCFLFAIEPHQVYYTFHILSDTLYVTLLLLTVSFLFQGLKEKNIFLLFVTAFLSGILALVRPIAEFLPLIFAGIIIFSKWGSLIQRIKIIFYCLILYAAVVLPWMMRNQSVYGHFNLCTTGQYTLLMYDAAYTEASQKKLPDTVVMAQFHQQAMDEGYGNTTNPFDKSAVYAKFGGEYIKKNIFSCSKKHLEGIINMMAGIGNKNIAVYFGLEEKDTRQNNSYSFSSNLAKIMNAKKASEIMIGIYIAAAMGVCYLFFIYGSIQMIRSSYLYIWLAMMSVVAYHCILTGVVGVNRYKLPSTPFLLIVAGYGVYFLFEKIASKKKIK